ncbi:glycoprotein Xg isoform X1 [Camelus dromedarius]|uniref:glycoprotein Xg isoform X1 n=1 Tax=Camelus dromedarius TaxID=9838 RepID=UPI00311A8568
MESWRGLFCLACLCLLTAARGQGDFDLADALDDPEPTKKPSSGIYPKPKPPYPPRPASPDHHGGGIYPPPKPPPRPQPGTYDNSGGFLSDKDLDDGRYPPRPRQPAGGGGGGGYYPPHDGYGDTHDRPPLGVVLLPGSPGAATTPLCPGKKKQSNSLRGSQGGQHPANGAFFVTLADDAKKERSSGQAPCLESGSPRAIGWFFFF